MDNAKNFLSERGALDLLFSLSNDPLGFNELKERINISPNTLLTRIKEAAKLGLVEETLVRTERRSLIKYTITKDGKKELESLKSIKDRYEKLNKLLKEQDEKKNNIQKEITELLSSINKTNRTDITISGNKITKSKNVNITVNKNNLD